MNNYLILIECDVCGYEEYFSMDNLPGGREHCPYCSECGALLPRQEPHKLAEQYFIIYPTGIDLKDAGTIPPVQAFDVLGYCLASKADELRWQAAAFCNLYRRYYPEIYEQKAQHFFVKPQTIEVWAYVERNVPPENRTTDKTIYHHRIVAKVDDKQEQGRYLKYCVDNNLSVRKLEKYVAEQRNEPIPPGYDDRQFEKQLDEHQEIEQLTRINSQFALRIQELEMQIANLQQSIDSSSELDTLASPIIEWLKNQTVNYSAVLIKRNGEVVIKP